MRNINAWSWSVLILSLLATSCAIPSVDREGSASSGVLLSSRVDAVVVEQLRTLLPPLAQARLSLSSSGSLASSPAGLSLLSLLVSCALPADGELTVSAGGSDVQLPGDAGLAGGWTRRPLD